MALRTNPMDRGAADIETVLDSAPQSDEGTEKGVQGPFYVDFEENDRRKPINFTKTQKWVTTAIACYTTLLASSAAAAYPLGFQSMMRDLNCTSLQAITGLSVYALGFGLFPLVTAPLSEEFGRKPLYIASMFIFVVMFMIIALAKNIQTVIIARFIQGAASSIGSAMVGGTIADIWSPPERGIPMSVFSLSGCMTAIGPIMAGWVEMNPRLEWRWIQWIQMTYSGVGFILTIFMKETRSEVLLMHLAQRVRKETGNSHFRARVEDERPDLTTLILISCTRAIYLTFTEPIVAAFSLWIGFAWGVVYSFLAAIPLVFETVDHFSIGLAGTAFVSMIIGSIFGLFTTIWQDYMYRKNYGKRGPEARLYAACFAGVLLPAGLFIFAWCTLPHVHWVGLNVGIVCFLWSIYIIYQTVFAYLSDCYGTWASSASAGQGLARKHVMLLSVLTFFMPEAGNLVATAFPLFTVQMFNTLTFKWGCTLFACIGALMMPIPFVLFYWGPAIRSRSKVSKKLAQV